MKNLVLITVLLATSGLTLTSCANTMDIIRTNAFNSTASAPARVANDDTPRAVALTSDITSTSGNRAPNGQLTLRPIANNGTYISGRITGLQPNGTYALHIHENGDCGNDGKAAGGHFNPNSQPHGHPGTVESHAGDMPNITADSNGIAEVSYANSKVSTSRTSPTSIYHRAFIIHSGADDYTSQPSGDAGSRIACGVIEGS